RRGVGPDPDGVARNERLRKDDQVRAFLGSLLDQVAGLLHPGFSIEERRSGVHCRCLNLRELISHRYALPLFSLFYRSLLGLSGTRSWALSEGRIRHAGLAVVQV